MKKNYVNDISTLLYTLPKQDIPVANVYLKKRELDALKELVDSAIIRVNKEFKKEEPKKYLEVDITKLLTLKAEIDIYIELVEGEYKNEEDEEEYN